MDTLEIKELIKMFMEKILDSDSELNWMPFEKLTKCYEETYGRKLSIEVF